MNYDFTPHALYFFGRDTRVIAPSLVNKLVGAIRQVAPRQRGNRVNDLSEMSLRFLRLVKRLLYILSHLVTLGTIFVFCAFRRGYNQFGHIVAFRLGGEMCFVMRFRSPPDSS